MFTGQVLIGGSCAGYRARILLYGTKLTSNNSVVASVSISGYQAIKGHLTETASHENHLGERQEGDAAVLE